jgi:hypothetical protein
MRIAIPLICLALAGCGSSKSTDPGKNGPGRAAPDPGSVENTRAWAADAVERLRSRSTTPEEVEQELKDALVGKQARWTFPVVTVEDGEVKVDSFFGPPGEPFKGEGAELNGRPTRRLYLRIYFDAEKDGIMVGRDITNEEARRVQKGDRQAVTRTVIEASVTKSDGTWVSASKYSQVLDVLDAYCITIVVARK